jgi:hypothetical protein
MGIAGLGLGRRARRLGENDCRSTNDGGLERVDASSSKDEPAKITNFGEPTREKN